MSTSFYHGSSKYFQTVSVLKPQIDGYTSRSNQELENLFDECKPIGCTPRRNAVFLSLTPNPDIIDALGGETECIYQVEPMGDVSICDLAWYSKAACLLEEGQVEEARKYAHIYWEGRPFEIPEHSCFEALCEQAKIIELIDCALDDEEMSLAAI